MQKWLFSCSNRRLGCHLGFRKIKSADVPAHAFAALLAILVCGKVLHYFGIARVGDGGHIANLSINCVNRDIRKFPTYSRRYGIRVQKSEPGPVFSPYIRVVDLWDHLPNDIVCATNINTLKARLDLYRSRFKYIQETLTIDVIKNTE